MEEQDRISQVLIQFEQSRLRTLILEARLQALLKDDALRKRHLLEQRLRILGLDVRDDKMDSPNECG